jgi:hypothetical protein
MSRYTCIFVFAFIFVVTALGQDQPKPDQPKQEDSKQEQAKPEAPKFMPPIARIRAAKTIFVRKGEGNDLPYNVIQSGIDSWPRFIPALSADKADIVAEVTAPEEESNLEETTTTTNQQTGEKTKAKTADERYVQYVKLTILDPRSKLPLWTATERPKGGMKKASREDNIIKSAQDLLRKFHLVVEPDVPQPEVSSK